MITLWCLINVPLAYQFLEIFDQNMVTFLGCNKLSNIDSFSRICCQNYLPFLNAQFRPYFAPLWILVLEITSDPRMTRPPIY